MTVRSFPVPHGYREARRLGGLGGLGGLGSSDIVLVPAGGPPITEHEALAFFQRAGYFRVHTWRDPQDYGARQHTLQPVSFYEDGSIQPPAGTFPGRTRPNEVTVFVNDERSKGDWRGARKAATRLGFGESRRDYVLPLWIRQEEAARPGRFRALSCTNVSRCFTHEWVDVLDTDGMYRDDWDPARKPYALKVYRIHQIVGHGTTASRLAEEDLIETYGAADIRPFVTKKAPPGMPNLPRLPGK